MRKVHHTTEMKECCTKCGRPFLMYWFNAEETSGQSETMWRNNVCTDCRTAENNGRPPLGLNDLNEIAKRKITKERYYAEQGY